MLFSSPFSTSSFCVFQYLREYLFSSYALLLPLCFFVCIQSNLLLQFPFCRFLRRYLPRKKRHCLGHNLCLTLTLLLLPFLSYVVLPCLSRSLRHILAPHRCSSFTILYFLLDWTMRRSIFRCADLIHLSCSFESVHVPDTYVGVGVITTLHSRILWHNR